MRMFVIGHAQESLPRGHCSGQSSHPTAESEEATLVTTGRSFQISVYGGCIGCEGLAFLVTRKTVNISGIFSSKMWGKLCLIKQAFLNCRKGLWTVATRTMTVQRVSLHFWAFSHCPLPSVPSCTHFQIWQSKTQVLLKFLSSFTF